MKLALVDIDAPALEAVAAECREMGAEVLTCETDVSVYEEAKASVQATMDRYGQIDVLFANAGIATAGSILHIPIRDWEWALAVNTMGIVHYVHESAHHGGTEDAGTSDVYGIYCRPAGGDGHQSSVFLQ